MARGDKRMGNGGKGMGREQRIDQKRREGRRRGEEEIDWEGRE